MDQRRWRCQTTRSRLADFRRVEHVGREDHAIAGAPDLPAEHEVFGEVVAQRADPADRVEGPPRTRIDFPTTHGVPSTSATGRSPACRQPFRYERLDPRAQAHGAGGAKQVATRGRPGDRGTTTRRAAETRPHADVAVGEEDVAVPGVPHGRRQPVDLGVAAGLPVVEDEGRGTSGCRSATRRARSVGGIRGAREGEHHSARGRIVEAEERLEVLLQPLVEAAQRLHDRDRGREKLVSRFPRWRRPEAQQRWPPSDHVGSRPEIARPPRPTRPAARLTRSPPTRPA